METKRYPVNPSSRAGLMERNMCGGLTSIFRNREVVLVSKTVSFDRVMLARENII